MYRHAAALLALLAACASLRHSAATRYQSIVLDVRGLGAETLRTLTERDPSIRAYVAQWGPPDFLYVANPDDVEFIYTQLSRLVHFHRTDEGTSAGELSPLPAALLNVLPIDIRAGTAGQLTEFPVVNCWRVNVAERTYRTCCRTRQSCWTSGTATEG